MILDADSYRVNIPYIALLTENLTDEERVNLRNVLAITTGVPIVIVCVYLGELYGFTDRVKTSIEKLSSYYAVSEIKGIRYKEE